MSKWPELPPAWTRRLWLASHGSGEHSVEVEHRLTSLESFTDHQDVLNRKTHKRLTRLERILIAILTGLHALVHDKLPEWAHSVSGFIKLLTT